MTGLDVSRHLLKRVMPLIDQDLPRTLSPSCSRTVCTDAQPGVSNHMTLSPIPGFVAWLRDLILSTDRSLLLPSPPCHCR